MKERDGYYFDPVRFRESQTVKLMSVDARLFYREVLDEIWINGSVPDDASKTARILKLPEDRFIPAWEEFRMALISTRKDAQKLTSPALEFERTRRNKFRKQQKLSGQTGGRVSAERRKLKKEQQLKEQGSLEQASSEIKPTPSPSTRTRIGKEKEGDIRALRSRPISQKTGPPPDFTITPEMRKWATSQSPGFTDLEIANETASMLDHFRGSGGTKSDWVATWRNWMRNSRKFRPHGPAGTVPPPAIPKPHGPHFCDTCEIPHEWNCEHPAQCALKQSQTCPDFARKWAATRKPAPRPMDSLSGSVICAVKANGK
jgi:hypothetical protein